MKRRFLSILLALVLVLSVSLVTAVPALADDTPVGGSVAVNPTVTAVSPAIGNPGVVVPVTITGTGFAQGNVGKWQGTSTVEYSKVQAHSPTYSVYLEALKVNSPADSAEVYVVPTGVTTLNDLNSVSFWYYAPGGGDPVPPQIDIWLDTNGTYTTTIPCTGDDDWLLGQFPLVTTFDAWVAVPLSDITWIRAKGTIYGTGAAGLIAAKAETGSVGSYGTLGNCPVLGIGIQAGSQATRAVNRVGDQKFYVDDLMINTTTYDMEPEKLASDADGGVSISGVGVTASNIVVVSESRITADFTLLKATTTTAGTRNVTVKVAGKEGTGANVFTVNQYIEVSAPSAINLGMMTVGPATSNVKSSTMPGSVVSNGTTSVKATDAKPENKGYMMSGTTPLAAKFQISKEGTNYQDADVVMDYGTNTSLPFYVSQAVAQGDPAGRYKITITFTGSY